MLNNFSDLHNELSSDTLKEEASRDIAAIANENGGTILEAIVEYVEENEIHEEDILTYLTDDIIKKLKYESIKRRLVNDDDEYGVNSRSLFDFL